MAGVPSGVQQQQDLVYIKISSLYLGYSYFHRIKNDGLL